MAAAEQPEHPCPICRTPTFVEDWPALEPFYRIHGCECEGAVLVQGGFWTSVAPRLSEPERIQLHASIKHTTRQGQMPIITQANWRDWMKGV